MILWLLWAHVVLLPVFAVLRGYAPERAVGWVVPVALLGVAGSLRRAGTRARSVAVALGLLSSSAILVYASGGRIEAHFHFFVMIAVLALYEDWLPFGIAVTYVVAEHGFLGVISPHAVYDHGGNPWMWAGIHGAFVLAAGTANVVTWRLNEDMRLRMSEANAHAHAESERFARAFDNSVTGMALLSPDGRYLEVNRALCEMTGYEKSELEASDFRRLTHPDDLALKLEQHRALLSGAMDTLETETRYLHRDGHEIWVQLGISAVRSETGEVRYFVAHMHDVTRRRQVEDELAHQALHDPLTGLANRALFLDRLRHALVGLRRHDDPVSLLFVDLDRFKLVNDGLGHAAGDAVLVETARRLEASVGKDDAVARFGGDEFTIVCYGARDDATRLAERVVEAIAEPFTHQGHELHLTASVGIRVCDDSSGEADSLLRDADLAMYLAKERGRARYVFFDNEAGSHFVQRLGIEHELRAALRDGDLRVHYQPSVRLLDGRIVGVEALVRWQHRERGLLMPADFIPTAEESGLIVPLGAWVLREACGQLAEWRADGLVGPGFRMSVNVSPKQLSRPDLPDAVSAALAAARLEPRALCIEITESAVVEDSAVALANLRRLKAIGVAIALDDFGVGASSLGRIQRLPGFDVIKIDRSFVQGLGQDGSASALAASVLSLAESLGLAAVAEGVETDEQLAELRRLGFEVAQGYRFERPQPAADLEATLLRQTDGIRADAA